MRVTDFVTLGFYPRSVARESAAGARCALSVARRLATLVLLGGLAVWIAGAVAWCVSGAPLGHDEARYASDTRALLDGSGKRFIYVPVGMNALTAPGLLAGGSESALRVLPLFAGIAFLGAAWWLARRAADRETACWTVGVLAGAHSMTRFSAQLLTDLPSAACLLVAIAILVRELRRDEGPTYRLVAAAPLAAGAFYIRYGSAPTIAVIALVSLVLGARAIARRPGPVIATAVLLGAALAPHALHAIARTGSPLGILRISREIPGHPGEGLVTYLTTNPFVSYGVLVAPLVVIGLATFRRGAVTDALRAIAVLQVIALGLTTFAQPRFVFLALVLLVIVGVATVRRWIASRPDRARRACTVAAAIAVVATWAISLVDGVRARDTRLATTTALRIASHAIRADARGERCDVIGAATTQLEWYSGCRTTRVVAGTPIYIVREVGEAPPALPARPCPVLVLPRLTVSRLPTCRPAWTPAAPRA